MFSSYVKVPQLKKILDEEVECEQKLDLIRNLVEGQKSAPVPPSPASTSANSNGDLSAVAPAATPEVSGSENEKGSSASNENGPDYSRVIEGIKGVAEKNSAILILDLIEQSPNVSYDKENLELILDGERIRYTNIKYLLKRIVSPYPAQFPVGFSLFIQYLKNINVPLHAFRSGDSKNILEDLERIKKERGESLSEPQKIEQGGEKETSLKRKFPLEEEEEKEEQSVEQVKRPRIETQEVAETSKTAVRRNFGQTKEGISKLRRSARLKKSLENTWASVADNAE